MNVIYMICDICGMSQKEDSRGKYIDISVASSGCKLYQIWLDEMGAQFYNIYVSDIVNDVDMI